MKSLFSSNSSSSNSTSSTSTIPELSLALSDLDWIRAEEIVRTKPNQASLWTVRYGLFDSSTITTTTTTTNLSSTITTAASTGNNSTGSTAANSNNSNNNSNTTTTIAQYRRIDAHCLPLHIACVVNAPVDTVNAILCAHLDAAKTRETSYSRLPLHCACRRRSGNCDIEIIKLLTKVYPAACLIPDDLGRLPLHYALSNNYPTRFILYLIQMNPKAVRGVDNRGWTPLHVACSAGVSSTSIISTLLEYCPEAVVLHTKKGSTPIECICPTMPNKQEVRMLLKVAKQRFDANFRYPLTTITTSTSTSSPVPAGTSSPTEFPTTTTTTKSIQESNSTYNINNNNNNTNHSNSSNSSSTEDYSNNNNNFHQQEDYSPPHHHHHHHHHNHRSFFRTNHYNNNNNKNNGHNNSSTNKNQNKMVQLVTHENHDAVLV